MAGRKRHTPEQIIPKRRHGDELAATGTDIEEIARQLDVSVPTLYNWRKQYGGMKADDAKEFKELKNENALLKKLLAEAELEKAALKGNRSGKILSPTAKRNAVVMLQETMTLAAIRLQNRRATAIHPTREACSTVGRVPVFAYLSSGQRTHHSYCTGEQFEVHKTSRAPILLRCVWSGHGRVRTERKVRRRPCYSNRGYSNRGRSARRHVLRRETRVGRSGCIIEFGVD